MISKFLDYFSKNDETLARIETRLINQPIRQFNSGFSNFSQGSGENSGLPSLLYVLTHPNYYGSSIGKTTFKDYFGSSEIDGKEIINYKVPSERL